MNLLDSDVLARAEAEVDRAFAEWSAAAEAARADGVHLIERVGPADRRLVAALRRWSDLSVAWAKVVMDARREEARDAA